MNLIDLLQCRSAQALDADASGRLLVISNIPGTFQLYEHEDGVLRQLTDFAEPVTGSYLPHSRTAVMAMDDGGNERHQLYLFDLDHPPLGDRAKLEPLTADPAHMYRLAGVTRDGTAIAFVSNKRNGVDFDVYLLDLHARQERSLYAVGGWCREASGFSPDGRWLSVLRPGPRPLDVDLMLIDVENGEMRLVHPHPDEAAVVSAPAWSGDESFFVGSNVGRDLVAIHHLDLAAGTEQLAIERGYDLECHTSPDGRTLLVVGNDGGASRAELFDVGAAGALDPRGELPLPGRGAMSFSLNTPPPLLSDDGGTVTYSFTSPTLPGDIWRYHRGGELERLTESPGLPADADGAEMVEATVHEVRSFDGETVPLFLFRPPAASGGEGEGEGEGEGGGEGDLTAVVLYIHGGPEAQSLLTFNPVVQGLVDAGYAVVVPNVRGSTGYGKRYAGLDDTTRRLDSVADLAEIHAWLPTVGLDPARAALMGGSYGGYMVLAGCAFQPGLWTAGVDVVGISDLVTFLENTSPYRRAHREHEYGSLDRDREFLAKASPLRSVQRMRAPLFVIHGANDPRVPLSEAEQLVSSLHEGGVPCELLVYADEGHGLQKLANRLDAYPQAVEFLKHHSPPVRAASKLPA